MHPGSARDHSVAAEPLRYPIMSEGVELDAKLSPATIFSLSIRFGHLPGTNKALKDFTKVTPNLKTFILVLTFY